MRPPTILLLAAALLLSGCDASSGYIFNVTSCPIQVTHWSIGAYYDQVDQIGPGDHYFRFGPSETRYGRLIIRDARGTVHDYSGAELQQLRDRNSSDDAWAYSDTGLKFVQPPPLTLDQLDQLQSAKRAGCTIEPAR
jgi:hypothetical protein